MEYRAVGKRCAVVWNDLRLTIPIELALTVLGQKGFEVLEIDVVSLARERIGRSRYRRCASLTEAPTVVDCSGFVKWLYGQIGLWLPRRAIQQRDFGWVVRSDGLMAGDLVFASGEIDYYHDNPADGVGHVGLATGNGTVIHATIGEGVREVSFRNFTDPSRLRGIRRCLPEGSKIMTLAVPDDLEIETADDIRWVILQSLPY